MSTHPSIVQIMAQEAVKQLTPKQKAIWDLFNLGMTQDQIAIKLNISQPVVSKHLKAAEKRIVKWGNEHKGLFNTLANALGPKEADEWPNGEREAYNASHKKSVKHSKDND